MESIAKLAKIVELEVIDLEKLEKMLNEAPLWNMLVLEKNPRKIPLVDTQVSMDIDKLESRETKKAKKEKATISYNSSDRKTS